jgi:type VI secretion system protein ImpL
MIIGIIFLVVLLATLWTVALVFHITLVLAIVPTAAVVVAVGAIFIIKRLQARAAAQAIEKTLKSQGEAFAAQVRPDQQPEVKALQSEFAKAVGALKSSKLARGGSDALGVLPWYLIIGPPGAGKSTALSKSGLQFPYLSAGGRGVKGVAGTRNCEWWLTNEAVILDTAGRYTTEDNDRDEWLSFLDMLARNRPKRPLNGLLVAVSVGDFIDLDEEGSAALGQRIRERIEEVMSRLKLVLPVYVLFTKCDLLAGFVETFGELNKNERGEIWGFTLPMERDGTPAEIFGAHFDELSTQVGNWSMARLGKARRLEERERIFQFPAQFEGLKLSMAEFLQTVFVENVYQDTPVMRGIYFTSGTQEGRPIDRVMRAMASAFGMQSALPEGEAPAQDPKSYFLRDVFSRVIFKDQSLAIRTSSANRRALMLQRIYTGAALAAAVLLLIFPTVSFFENLSLIRSTREMVAALKGELDTGSTHALRALNPLQRRLNELVEWQKDGPPWSMRFGMYQGDSLLERTEGFYGTTVRDLLVKPLLDRDDRSLVSFVKDQERSPTALNARDHLQYWEALKLHLLLTAPKGKLEPELDSTVQAWLLPRLTEPWLERVGAGTEDGKAVKAHTTLYLRLLASDPSLALPRDEVLVKRSREQLQRLPLTDLALARLISDVGRDDTDLTLGSMLGGTVPELTSNRRVRSAFTKKAYDEKAAELLKSGLQTGDSWVLSEVPDDSSKGTRDLQSAYFRAYADEWQKFLESIKVASTERDRSKVQALLEDLTSGATPPLARLFSSVGYNTRLTGKVEEMGLDLKGKLEQKFDEATQGNVPLPKPGTNDPNRPFTATDLRQYFEGFVSFGSASSGRKSPDAPKEAVPLDSYQEQLILIRDALRADTQDAAGLGQRLQSARTRVEGLVNGQGPGWYRPVLASLLVPPVDMAYQLVLTGGLDSARAAFCSAVGEPFKRLAGRYPFSRTGQDAPMADVADFFKPKSGQLWGHYESDMHKFILQAGDRFIYGPGQPHVYGTTMLTYLSRANEVTRALFPPGGNDVVAAFVAHIQPSPHLASIALTIDGETVDYRNGPEIPHAFKWPQAGKASGASIHVRDSRGQPENIDQEGEWGLLRLFELGEVRSVSASNFAVAWQFPISKAEVVIDFRPARSDTPFFGSSKTGHRPQALQPFRAPGLVPPTFPVCRGGG